MKRSVETLFEGFYEGRKIVVCASGLAGYSLSVDGETDNALYGTIAAAVTAALRSIDSVARLVDKNLLKPGQYILCSVGIAPRRPFKIAEVLDIDKPGLQCAVIGRFIGHENRRYAVSELRGVKGIRPSVGDELRKFVGCTFIHRIGDLTCTAVSYNPPHECLVLNQEGGCGEGYLYNGVELAENFICKRADGTVVELFTDILE